MFTKLFVPVLLVSSAVIPAFSLPAPLSPGRIFARDNQGDNNSTQGNGNCSTSQNVVYLNDTASRFPDLVYLAAGNQDFRSAVANSSNPNLLQDLTTNGQHPEYLFLGCRFVPSPPVRRHFL
jgi:hypothetical protein